MSRSARRTTRRQFILGSTAGGILLATGGCITKTGRSSIVSSATDKGELPVYSALKANPKPAVPEDLLRSEKSDLLLDRAQALQQALSTPPRRPPENRPLFTFFVGEQLQGVVTFGMPSLKRPLDGRCVPVFTSAIDAADYRRLQLADLPNRYIVSNASQFLAMLRDVEKIGVETLAFNRCPRCTGDGKTFGGVRFVEPSDANFTLATDALKTPSDVIEIWSVLLAKQTARVEMYLAFALKEARAGQLKVARTVGLSGAGHVTLSDPRLHLLLGHVAIGLHDRALLGEAKAFLGFLRDEARARALAQAETAGVPDFSPETFA